jgi:circadian clock protein KaiC
LRRGEPGLYVNFQENPIQLARTIQSLGIDIEDAKRKGLHLLYASPVELQIDSILVTLFRTIEERKIKRVAVDAIGDLVGAATDLTRLYNYLYALVQHFVVRRIASVMTLETGPGRGITIGPISVQSDVIVRLQLERRGDTTRRTLQVVKARGTNHDLNTKELRITASGIELI